MHCDVMNAHRGVVYLAYGQKYIEEAQVSAQSVKRFMPNLKIVVFTDASPTDPSAFDAVTPLVQTAHPRTHSDKLACMLQSPFDQTLFLDTDTFVCAAFSELFDLMEHFDIAMTHDRRYVDWFPENTGVPDAFREFNQGVVVFRRSDGLRDTLEKAMLWADRIAAETGITYDQPPLRIALYHSNLRIAALTHEYNCRYHSFGYLNGEVKILHGRIPGKLFVESNLQRIVARLNRKTIPRVFVGGQVYALEFSRILLGTRYTYSSRIGTLFRPRLAFASRITQLCVRALREKGILRSVRILLSKLQRKRAAP
jgi:hypothetical protein